MAQRYSSLVNNFGRRSFIGGSDARIIMGNDEAALVRLWQEKRGEIQREDLSALARGLSLTTTLATTVSTLVHLSFSSMLPERSMTK